MSNRPDVTLRSGSVELVFHWQGDCYQHRLVGGGVTATSFDSDEIETPVFTDLHQQGDLLFLSGNAGVGHWSASVEPKGNRSFTFDIALRLKQPTMTVGTVYSAIGEAPDFKPELGCKAELHADAGRPEDAHWVLLASDPTDRVPSTTRYVYRLLVTS